MREELKLPFSIDRAADVELSTQIARGFRAAIQSGNYAPGQKLPGIRQIARQLRTSNVAVTQAIDELVKDGLIATRPRSGTRVLARNERTWRGHILWLGGTMQSFYFSSRQEVVARGIGELNLRLTTINYAGDDMLGDAAMLSSCLQTMGISMLVKTVNVPGVQAICLKHGIPLIDCSDEANSTVDGMLVKNHKKSMLNLAEHVASLGIDEAIVLSPHLNHAQNAEQVFASVGMPLAYEPISWQPGTTPVEGNELAGYATARNLISQKRLPQLIFVTDDYMARGCLTALLEASIRIPEDVQLVVISNRGNKIAFKHEFTRIENDPVAEGKAILELIKKVESRNEPQTFSRSVEPVFIVGKTTRQL